jgi:hypothetical protein
VFGPVPQYHTEGETAEILTRFEVNSGKLVTEEVTLPG